MLLVVAQQPTDSTFVPKNHVCDRTKRWHTHEIARASTGIRAPEHLGANHDNVHPDPLRAPDVLRVAELVTNPVILANLAIGPVRIIEMRTVFGRKVFAAARSYSEEPCFAEQQKQQKVACTGTFPALKHLEVSLISRGSGFADLVTEVILARTRAVCAFFPLVRWLTIMKTGQHKHARTLVDFKHLTTIKRIRSA